MSRKTPAHLQRGQAAEQQALTHLEQHGLKLYTRNYHCPHGEIDLIMRDQGQLVFVEVRFRQSSRFGSPAETVDTRKQAKLRATAEHFLQHHRGENRHGCRFDVVAISGDTQEAPLQWVKDAF